MTSIATLTRHLAVLQKKAGSPADPRGWYLLLAETEDIPAHITAQLRENDSVSIQRYPDDFDTDEGPRAEHDEPSIGWLIDASNITTILYRSGQVTYHTRR